MMYRTDSKWLIEAAFQLERQVSINEKHISPYARSEMTECAKELHRIAAAIEAAQGRTP